MNRRSIGLATSLALVATIVVSNVAAAGTLTPGQQKKADRNDADNNGYPDAGVVVTGAYTSVYAYDASGDYYWDLGDGRVYTSAGIGSIEDLDQATLSVCDYHNQYRGTFDNDPFMDSGWIKNNIRCYGYDGNGTFNYQIVHQTDPRYRGNPDWAVWGTWEYHVLTESGNGNLVRPYKPL